MFDRIVVPPAVETELAAPHAKAPTIHLRNLSFIEVLTPKDAAAVAALSSEIDTAEAEAIVLAGEIGADLLLIDERAGRQLASQMGLKTMGVLGVLLNARHRALIGAIKPELNKLRNQLGFFISNRLYDDLIARAGEA